MSLFAKLVAYALEPRTKKTARCCISDSWGNRKSRRTRRRCQSKRVSPLPTCKRFVCRRVRREKNSMKPEDINPMAGTVAFRHPFVCFRVHSWFNKNPKEGVPHVPHR